MNLVQAVEQLEIELAETKRELEDANFQIEVLTMPVRVLDVAGVVERALGGKVDYELMWSVSEAVYKRFDLTFTKPKELIK